MDVFNTTQDKAPTINTTEEQVNTGTLIDHLNLNEQELNYINMLKEKDAFVVAMRQVEAVYVVNDDEISGFHYRLIHNFADQFGLNLEVKTVDISDYWKDETGDVEKVQTDPTYAYNPVLFDEVDIYCDSLTVVPWRKKLVQFIEVYPKSRIVVNSKGLKIQTLEI